MPLGFRVITTPNIITIFRRARLIRRADELRPTTGWSATANRARWTWRVTVRNYGVIKRNEFSIQDARRLAIALRLDGFRDFSCTLEVMFTRSCS